MGVGNVTTTYGAVSMREARQVRVTWRPGGGDERHLTLLHPASRVDGFALFSRLRPRGPDGRAQATPVEQLDGQT